MKIARLAISAIIAIILMSVLFFVADPSRIISTFLMTATNPVYLFFFIVVFIVSFVFRAIRLRFIVGDKSISHKFFLEILFVSWCLNVFIPARVGEAVQIALLNSNHKVPVGRAAASIVLDKILDLVSLVTLTSTFLIVLGGNTSEPIPLSLFVPVAVIILVVLITGLLLVTFAPTQLSRIIDRLFNRWPRIADFLRGTIKSAHLTIKGVTKSKRIIPVLFLLSFLVWLCESSTLIFITWANGYTFPIEFLMVANMAAFLSMTLPITPGGFGTYEFVMAFTMSVLVPEATLDSIALPLSIVEHSLRQVCVLILGILAATSLGAGLTDILRMARRSTDSSDRTEENEHLLGDEEVELEMTEPSEDSHQDYG